MMRNCICENSSFQTCIKLIQFMKPRRKNKCSSLSLPDGKILYSVASGSFLCVDVHQLNGLIFILQEKDRSSEYLEQLSLSFFASLFTDRQGHIYNMTEDSIHSSLLMNLYSGFNRIVLNPTCEVFHLLIHSQYFLQRL